MGNVKEIIEGVKAIGTDGWKSIKTIANFLNYLMHPSLIIEALWNYTQVYAFWICLFIALLSAVMYTLGFKKFAKYIPCSMAIYTLIKMLGSAF